jgi:uncharacterized membrane protein (UPF0127 family)
MKTLNFSGGLIHFILIALLTYTVSASAQTAPAMPRLELKAGFYRVEAEVAANQEDRMRGLMQRSRMAAHQGMLFVFPQTERHCMWMKNTLIPLSVAFLDEAGSIINIRDMRPQTEVSHCADAPARFALEMNRGWFADKGVKPGMRILGLDKAPAPQ